MTNQKDQSDERRFQDLDEDSLLFASGGVLENTGLTSSAPPSPALPKPTLQRSKSLPTIRDLGAPSDTLSPEVRANMSNHLYSPSSATVLPFEDQGRPMRLVRL